jgi:hypothetical protein
MELCGVGSLSFAVGVYLPLSTTAPIAIGGLVRAAAGSRAGESELGPGNLFATGLVAGGAIAGVAVAIAGSNDRLAKIIGRVSLEHALSGKLGPGGYQVMGLAAFLVMAVVLLRVARRSK